ncbi:hypothetical protein L5F68_02015 [Aliarcobacter butzleri]|uniref:DUF6602 domain-containing protein n=1 Tax=Aliarcobacter butzleri TaxID=28197 RepID=UPI001EDB5D27|nr:DUF6602 domain-containing protein [Aliarcobacter butzleri]MCG3703103.1 hypothetical protein [Aliarcobacter butzleri]MCG3709975.1 hypothetical protein [Aliarcobacter butzleri]MCG3715548.1 hypothetical protein [Aliarcobacter butzleri]
MKFKHNHGTNNEIIEQEEKSILLAVDRALSSSSNSQTIGRNGELPLIDFLNKYLPPTLKAVSGHFLTPNGNISPQIDVMIIDTRYPFLSVNLDGSVLAMLHSVIHTIELKTNLISSDIKKISSDISKIRMLINEVEEFDDIGSFMSPINSAFAYRIKNKLETIELHFQNYCKPELFHFDLMILCIEEKEFKKIKFGCELHYEPIFGKDFSEEELKELKINNGFLFGNRPCYTPLSDFYYSLVQNSYYILGERDYSFNQIGRHIMDYMSWSTASWNDLYKE